MLLSGVVATLLLGSGAVSVDAAVGFTLAPEARAALLGVGVVGGLASLVVPRLSPTPDQPAM